MRCATKNGKSNDSAKEIVRRDNFRIANRPSLGDGLSQSTCRVSGHGKKPGLAMDALPMHN